MKQIYSLTLSLLGGLLLFTGCVKEKSDMNELYRPEGTPITFTAATGYENGNGTRTEYSGALYGESHNLLTDVSTIENTYERIDWVVNDQIKLYYTHPGGSTSSNYQITGKTNDNELSHGTISVMPNNQNLVWAGGSGDHVFTGMYPAKGFGGNNSISFDGTTIGGLIPSTQTLRTTQSRPGIYLPQMQYAYMAAYKKIDGSSTESEVHLPFVPAMTTFEFRFRMPAQDIANGKSGASYKVKAFSMKTSATNDYLAGNFTIDIDGADANGRPILDDANAVITNNANRSTEVSVAFSTPVELDDDTDLTFTLLTLPIDHSKITLTITYDDGTTNGKTKSVNLKTPPVNGQQQALTFDACKKYIITNYVAGYDEWEYFVDASNDVVTYGHDAASGGLNIYSYKQSKVDPNIKAIVPWKIQYTTVANPSESDWINLTSSGVNDATLNATYKVGTLTGQGAYPANPTANTASVTGQTPGDSSGEEGGNDPGTAARAKLASAQPRGTSANPFDLSRHPFYGNNIDGNAGSVNSANCYIVSAPGYYMFPCVYGNSIKNDNINVSSYSPSTATDAVSATGMSELKDVNTTYNTTSYPSHYYLPTFRNAWNNPITSYDIFTDCSIASGVESAIVVWQDTSVDDEIIPYKSGQITNPDELGIISRTVNGRTYHYIWFKIDAENIKPGNIMIALRDGSHIVWSWHIWVTEKDLEPTASDSYQLTLDDNSTVTFTLMPFNLGWLDSAAGSVTKYKDREIQYRVIQNDGISTLSDLFKFTQIGDAKTITPTVGGNPYYQWGRKDPLIASTEGGGNRPFSQNPQLGVNISPTVGVPHVQSNSADYGTAILHPYYYYSNNLTTGYVGGTAYPFWSGTGYRLTKDDRGNPYFRFQLDYYIGLGLTNEASVEFVELNGQASQSDMWSIWRIKTNGYYNVGPYTAAQVRQFVDWQFNAGHFADGDFVNDNWGYTPAQKEAAVSSMYNLWNAFIYSDQPTRGTFNGTLPNATMAAANHRNKFKTIYDPCPAGFAVPSKASYLGNSTINYREVAHATGGPNNGPYTERWKGGAPFSGASISPSSAPLTGVGVTVSGQLFPFTGARVCYNDGAGNVILSPEGQGERGFYWTDNPLSLEPIYSADGTGNYYVINSYYFYQHSYIFMFGYENGSLTGALQDFTRGSAGSIRPMLETNSNDI